MSGSMRSTCVSQLGDERFIAYFRIRTSDIKLVLTRRMSRKEKMNICGKMVHELCNI
ncbi:hypothetical protein HOLleu_25893 [Holothuria leucospilota]|uniref:Uncharacterized protein n=1 Tax=Holothuria leucospilota TaxID=206669 RepID=A0A9Q1BTJ0_HOLLE|nr:hypothetical protein HOLleu_25893 [Holothuria leucospilota]